MPRKHKTPEPARAVMARRRTCPICRRRCWLWKKQCQLRHSPGELAELVRKLHRSRRDGGTWPETELRKAIEWPEAQT